MGAKLENGLPRSVNSDRLFYKEQSSPVFLLGRFFCTIFGSR